MKELLTLALISSFAATPALAADSTSNGVPVGLARIEPLIGVPAGAPPEASVPGSLSEAALAAEENPAATIAEGKSVSPAAQQGEPVSALDQLKQADETLRRRIVREMFWQAESYRAAGTGLSETLLEKTADAALGHDRGVRETLRREMRLVASNHYTRDDRDTTTPFIGKIEQSLARLSAADRLEYLLGQKIDLDNRHEDAKELLELAIRVKEPAFQERVLSRLGAMWATLAITDGQLPNGLKQLSRETNSARARRQALDLLKTREKED